MFSERRHCSGNVVGVVRCRLGVLVGYRMQGLQHNVEMQALDPRDEIALGSIVGWMTEELCLSVTSLVEMCAGAY